MNGRPITLVSLISKQIYEDQLKLKKEKIVENESLYIKMTFFANKVLFVFYDDVILCPVNDYLTLQDVFHDTNSSLNLFKDGENDTNQVRSECGLKLSTNQFC
jgi:hypothetical protein